MCPQDTQLIRLVAGELPEPERRALADHIARCDTCQARQRELAATWDLLGEFQVPPAGRDLAPQILARARRAGLVRSAVAVAASLVAAAGVGIAVGLATLPGAPASPVAQTQPAVTEQQAIHAAGLDALGAEPLGFDELFVMGEEPQ